MEGICNHCIQVKEVKEVGVWTLCSDHAHLKQYQPREKKVNKIPHESKKRSKDNKEYAIVRIEYLDEHKICECCIIEEHDPPRPSNQIHHIKGKRGSLLTDKTNFMALCQPCHERIEKDRVWAIKKGYSIKRLNK